MPLPLQWFTEQILTCDKAGVLASCLGGPKAVYGDGPHTTPKSLAQFLRGAGMGLKNIAAICQLRFGVGSASSVRRWTDPTVDEKWNAYRRAKRNAKSYAPVKRYARNLFTRGFTKAEIVRRCQKRYRQGSKSSIACWVG